MKSLVWIFLISIVGAQKLLVTPLGNQVVTSGAGVMFSCVLKDSQNENNAELAWYNAKMQPIKDTVGRIHVESEGPSVVRLFVQKVSKEDEGTYFCIANVKGRRMRQSAVITVFEKITFFNTPSTFSAMIGEQVLIPCAAQGNPKPDISWRFRLRKVPAVSEKYQYENNGLRIYKLSPSDNGIYECRAEIPSIGALKVKHVNVNVKYAPYIISKPNSTTVIKGSDVSFRCNALGNPTVRYEWYKERRMSNHMQLKVRLDEAGNKLTIAKVGDDDEARYFCRAINALGTTEAAANLHIMIPPNIEAPQHKITKEGGIAVLPCQASGSPAPVIAWTRPGRAFEFTEGEQKNDPRINVDNTKPGFSKLIVNGLIRSDAGKYTCIARNAAGAQQKNVTVTVEYKPTVLAESPDESYGWRGQVRNFTCSGIGVPRPTIRWYRRHQYISTNATFTVLERRNNSNKTISKLLISINNAAQRNYVYGSYSCIVKNRHGSTTRAYHLHQAHTPDMPRNVLVVKKLLSSVTLVGTLPGKTGGLPLVSWRAQIWPDVNRSAIMTQSFALSEPLVIANLRPNTKYTMMLSVGNAVGFGKPVRFRVKTPITELDPPRSIFRSDFPRPDQPRWQEKVNHTKAKDKTSKVKDVEVRVRASRTKMGIGAWVGAVLAGIILLLCVTMLCVVIHKRRRRTEQRYYHKKEVEEVELNQHTLPPPQQQQHLPDVLSKNHVNIVENHLAEETEAFARHLGQSSYQTISSSAQSVQKLAWEQAMKVHAHEINIDRMSRLTERNSTSSLPPPPSYLLDDETAPPRPPPHQDGATLASYHAVLDGYHSGDNVDQDDCSDTETATLSRPTLPRQPQKQQQQKPQRQNSGETFELRIPGLMHYPNNPYVNYHNYEELT